MDTRQLRIQMTRTKILSRKLQKQLFPRWVNFNLSVTTGFGAGRYDLEVEDAEVLFRFQSSPGFGAGRY